MHALKHFCKRWHANASACRIFFRHNARKTAIFKHFAPVCNMKAFAVTAFLAHIGTIEHPYRERAYLAGQQFQCTIT